MSRDQIADLRAAVATNEQQLGANHPTTLKARTCLALEYRERELNDDAAELKHVVAIYDAALGRNIRTR
jgi:hypothetical protein